jgi:hypothetical protein
MTLASRVLAIQPCILKEGAARHDPTATPLALLITTYRRLVRDHGPRNSISAFPCTTSTPGIYANMCVEYNEMQ